MSVETAPTAPPDRRVTRPVLDLVVPVFDEEAVLEASLRRLHAHLTAQLPYPFRITIADNASTDATPLIARRLAAELPGVEVVSTAVKGRGGALHAVWSASDARVLAYCDVDLSTDLAALLPLVAPLISGHTDLAIGTRLGRGSRAVGLLLGTARRVVAAPSSSPPCSGPPPTRCRPQPPRTAGRS